MTRVTAGLQLDYKRERRTAKWGPRMDANRGHECTRRGSAKGEGIAQKGATHFAKVLRR
jgi:hypothetical protein